jgi:hypothetical protein
MEMQQTLKAGSTMLDQHMMLLFGIMIVMGILGGIANYFLQDRDVAAQKRSATRHAVLGVVAAFTVPLFLNMISSNLMDAGRVRPVDIFVFAGFVLIYVVVSRRFFENAANRLLQQVDQVRGEVKSLQEANAQTAQRAAELELQQEAVVAAAVAAQAANGGAAAPGAEPAKTALSYNDVELLRVIADGQVVYGNLSGLSSRTSLQREQITGRLAVLKSARLIETRMNDKNVLHWIITPRGKQLLDEVMNGQQEERREVAL